MAPRPERMPHRKKRYRRPAYDTGHYNGKMIKFFCNTNGFVETTQWTPHCWVSVECPDKNDLSFLVDELGVPDSFLESVADADERPRVEHEREWRLTILRIPLRLQGEEMPYGTVPIGIISGNEVTVTLCYRFTELIPDFIEHTRCRGIEVNTEPDFILRILFSSAYWYLRYLKDINNEVMNADKELQKSVRNEDLRNLMRLQRTLVFFNTSIRGNETVIGRLRRVYGDNYDTDLLEDVEIELRQADNTVNIYSDILGSTMDSFASIISNNVNAIMKKMTAVSVVLMVPTLIASFYGMNVSISHGNSPYMFWLIIVGSFLLSGVVYLLLRKIRWF